MTLTTETKVFYFISDNTGELANMKVESVAMTLDRAAKHESNLFRTEEEAKLVIGMIKKLLKR